MKGEAKSKSEPFIYDSNEFGEKEETFDQLMSQIEGLKSHNEKIRQELETLENQEGALIEEQNKYGEESDDILSDLRRKIDTRKMENE